MYNGFHEDLIIWNCNIKFINRHWLSLVYIHGIKCLILAIIISLKDNNQFCPFYSNWNFTQEHMLLHRDGTRSASWEKHGPQVPSHDASDKIHFTVFVVRGTQIAPPGSLIKPHRRIRVSCVQNISLTFSTGAHESFSETNHILGHKDNLLKIQKIHCSTNRLV